MRLETSGTAKISRASDGLIFEVDREEVDWEAVGGSERQMGPETEYRAEIQHDELGLLTWSLWEYPAEVVNLVSHDLNGHELVSDFDIAFVGEPQRDELLYYQEYDELGISADELRALPVADQVPYLVFWFRSYFEDPAMETPYNSDEGGYLYIWGGPYDAADELWSEFEGFANEDAIELAVEEVQADGIFEWAPGPRHPDQIRAAEEHYESDLKPSLDQLREQLQVKQHVRFDSEAARRAQSELAQSTRSLLEALENRQAKHGGIGHNGPPLDDNGIPLPSGFEDGIRAAAIIVLVQAEADEPDTVEVIEAVGRLQRFRNWMQPRIDTFADTLAEESAKALATGIKIGGGLLLASLILGLDTLIAAAIDWLSILAR